MACLDPFDHLCKYLAPSSISEANGVLNAPTVTVYLRDRNTILYTLLLKLHLNR